MKTRIIIFITLIAIFAPIVSSSMMVPEMDLTVVVNTQGYDSSFDFNLDWKTQTCDPDTYVCSWYWQNYQNFTLQTQNLTTFQTFNALSWTTYSLSQDVAPGLKIDSVICTSDNPNDNFSYTSDSVEITLTGWSNIICTFNNVKAQGKTPVLIVPGLLGTELKDGSELLWADPVAMLASGSDNFMDTLSFSTGLTPINSNVYVFDILRSKIGYDYLDGLINEFDGQGYIENQTLFTFPYDWRYGVTGKYADGKTNSDLLKEKIDETLQQTGSDKVDVVAHSLGGLIVKEYTMEHSADNHIGKAVFVGVPNTGAPKAAKALLQGDNFNIHFDLFGQTFGLSEAEIKKISENMPAVYDLLPSQQYYNEKGSYVEVVNVQSPYTINSDKNLNYNESKSFLTQDHSLNPLAMSNSENLHTQNFDNYDLRATGVDVYAIDGCKAGTLGKIVEMRTKNVYGPDTITYSTPKETPGDGTVPLESATNLPIDQDNKYYALVSDHGKMPSQNGIRQEIVNLISDSNLDTGKNIWGNDLITQDVGNCELNGKAVEVFSPVNISVTDQSGNTLGLADDNSITNNIPNADFEVWGEPANPADRHKFVYLPTDEGQTYSINLRGTGDGTYTIKADEIKNSQTTSTETFSNLPVNPELTGSINIGAGSEPTTLTIKQNSGSEEQAILPDFLSDKTAPEAVILFDLDAKDLKFYGTDNVSDSSEIIVQDNDNVITLTDKAGNITKITLKDKDRKKKMSAEIKSIEYNGMPADISKNKMVFSWNYDKKGNLKKLSQQVKSKKDYNITAEYNGKQTKITGKDFPGKIKETSDELKLLKITTDKGDLTWSY